MIHRRSFITGLISLVAAPAIVRVSSIMPVKVMEPLAVRLTRQWVLDLEEAYFFRSPHNPYLLVSQLFKEAFDEAIRR